jgi:hypothetical protein
MTAVRSKTDCLGDWTASARPVPNRCCSSPTRFLALIIITGARFAQHIDDADEFTRIIEVQVNSRSPPPVRVAALADRPSVATS